MRYNHLIYKDLYLSYFWILYSCHHFATTPQEIGCFFHLIWTHEITINQGMKKTWIYKRKGIKGWWVGWYESGKRKTKALPSKALAEHFRKIKYAQLNSDVFTGIISVDWKKMLDEYLHSKKVAGYVEDSIYEAALTLRHFERIIGKCNSKQKL